MLAHAEAADQRLREDQTILSGHLRLFATIDSGQSIVTRLVSSFLQSNSKVTAELSVHQPPVAHDRGGLRRRNPARQNHDETSSIARPGKDHRSPSPLRLPWSKAVQR